MATKYGKVLVNGQAEGAIAATDVPLSFWGGLNPVTGEIIDHHHPLWQQNISGKVFVLPTGRGSCTGSGILLESIYSNHSPAAIILKQADDIIALGSIVAEEILKKSIPILCLTDEDFEDALKANYAFIDKDGKVELV
jgi:predicted aconitase with swiveling domain